MAKIEIQNAFVEPWNKNQPAHPSWGMKTAEKHDRKDEQGNYQTVARTYRTVKVSRESAIDLTQFVQGSRVQIWGREVTEVREHEGKKYYDLVVWADRVEVLQAAQQSQGGAGQPGNAGSGDWAQPSTNGAQNGFNDPNAFGGEF